MNTLPVHKRNHCFKKYGTALNRRSLKQPQNQPQKKNKGEQHLQLPRQHQNILLNPAGTPHRYEKSKQEKQRHSRLDDTGQNRHNQEKQKFGSGIQPVQQGVRIYIL